MPLFRRSEFDNDDGYLLPRYWRCVACAAGGRPERACAPVRANVFLLVVENQEFMPEIATADRVAAKDHVNAVHGALTPTGWVEPEKRFERTAQFARDMGGSGFDAVYLCDRHVEQLQRALDAL
jgi:hypothetical protein